jgi:uncharacterized delta-60 repeat protein
MQDVSVSSNPSTATRGLDRSKPGILLRAALLTTTVLLCSFSTAMGQAGSLDSTFATGGIFLDSAGIFNNMGTIGTVVGLQSNGQIIVGGQIGFAAAVVRLNTNGTLDSSFGTGGTVTISFPGSNDGPSQVVGVAVQSDGKILAAISNSSADNSPLFILARLDTNGSLDTAFGTAGIVETTINPPFGATLDVMALQPNGKILLAGASAMARYDTSGQLDTTFGTGGIATILAITPTAIALQPDGKILIADGGNSTAGIQPFGPGFASPGGTISRYKTNGAIDATFGIFGQAASVAAISAITVEIQNGCVSTCNILVAGTAFGDTGNPGFGLVRFKSSGTIDTTFGTKGGVITSFSPSNSGFTDHLASAFAVVLQANGDIVAAGAAGPPSGATAAASAFALARYSGTGVLDPTFGSSGEVTTLFGNNTAAIYALALQSNGDIVAVGSSQHNVQGNQTGGIVVARYLAQ